MTPEARAFCIHRLTSAADLAGLARVWDSFGVDAKHDPKVRATKDALKAEFQREGV